MKKRGNPKRVLAVLCAVAMVVTMFPTSLMFGGISFAEDGPATEVTEPADGTAKTGEENTQAQEGKEVTEPEQKDKEVAEPEKKADETAGSETPSGKTGTDAVEEKKPEVSDDKKADDKNGEKTETGTEEKKDDKDGNKDEKKDEKKDEEKAEGYKVEFDFGENYARFNPINPKTTDKDGKIELPEMPKARDEVYKAEDGKEYYFTGWEYKDHEYEPGDTVTLKGDAKFKAVWKQTYTIEFSAKGIEADEVEPQTEVYGEDVVLPEETPNKEGLDFIGWTPDKGKTVYAAEETIPAKSIQPKLRSAKNSQIRLLGVTGDVTGPAMEVTVNSAENSTWKVEASDPSGIKTIEYKTSSDGVYTPLYTAPADEQLKETVEAVTGSLDASVRTLYLKAVDGEGNENELPHPIPENIESEAPSITTFAGKSGDDLSVAAKKHDFTYTVKDNPETNASGIKKIKIVVGGKEIYSYEPSAEEASGEITKTTNVSVDDSLNGELDATLTVTDNCNNSSTSTIQKCKYDNKAPVVKSVTMPSVAVAGYYNAGNAKVTVEFDEDASGVDDVSINNEPAAESEGKWTADLGNISQSDGVVNLVIAAKDKAGNEDTNCKIPDGSVKSFTLDRKAPKLVSVTTTPGETGGSPRDGYYYYGEAATSKYTISDSNPNTLKLEYTQDGVSKTGSINDDKTEATGNWTLDSEQNLTKISGIKLSATDKAGNLLVNDCTPAAEDTVDTVSGGVVTFKYGKIVDTYTPQVSINYNTVEEAGNPKPKVYLYKENEKIKGYVSGFVTATVTITDNEPLRLSDIYVTTNDGLKKISDVVDGDQTTITLPQYPGQPPIRFMEEAQGSYQYIVYGKDFAKHELKTTENVPDGVKISTDRVTFENIGVKDATSAAGKLVTFVRDTVAPTYTTTFTPGIDPTENVDSDDIAYYNKDFTAQIDIAEENIDTERLKAYVQSNTSPDVEYYSTAVLGDKTDMVFDEENKCFKNEYGTDGVYKFCVYGEDKAGNMLVKSESEDAKTDYTRSVKDELTDGKYWSMKKVHDTDAPRADVSIDDFFKVTLDGISYNPETYEPFQKNKTSATIKVTQKDKSPVKIIYNVPWKNPGGSGEYEGSEDKSYRNGASDEHVMTAEKGKGIQFSVDDLVITDRAGNKTAFSESGEFEGYVVFLDNANPKPSEKVDAVKPFTSIKATSSVTKRSVDGQDLYSNSVKVKFIVVDPYANKSSSGLKKINYEILVNGKKIDEGRLKDLVGADAVLLDKKEADQKDKVKKRESLQYEFEKEIRLKSYKEAKDDTFETNDIVVRLFAEDNAGNDGKASTKFGIDTVGPKVKVTYDNNSAQNKKYFKANRTATVTVTERNLGTGSDKIKIKTQVNVPSNWTYKAGSVPGNDDQWTKYLHYNKDGDYTLGVSGTDALGNPADITYEGTAPRDFVIDKTRPIIRVTFDNNNVRNKKYYKANRTATVRITEHNFAVKDYKVAGKAVGPRKTGLAFPSTGRFSSNGDVRTAAIPFTREGSYNFKVDYTDLAGNKAKTIVVDEFVIDKTAPVVKIENVINGGIYGGTVAPRAVFDDDTFNRNESTFRFTGVRQVDRSALVPGFRANGEYGGSYVMSDFPHIRANDDIYTAYATSTDMAGNTTTVQVVFSVNRFGSTYDYNGDEATISLVSKETGRYYTNKATPLVIREINVNPLKSYELTLDRGGNTVKLKEGTDYTVAKSTTDQGTVYVYKIKDSIVTDEGSYNIVVKSTDEAGNINTNAAIRSEKDSTEVPLRFVYDTTAPTMSFTNIGDGDKTIELKTTGSSRFSGIDLLDLGIVPDDDWSLGSIQYVLSGRDGVVFDSGVIKGDEFWKVMGEDGLKRFEQEIQHGSDVKTLDVTVWDAAGNKTAQSYKILVTKNALEVAAHYWYIVLLILAALGGGYAYYRKRKQDSEESEEAA